MAITARMAIAGAQSRASSGRMGMLIRMNPYEPSFNMMAARRTEPTVGAAVWASGSQVWNGHIGTLTANPRNRAPNTRKAKVPVKGLSKLAPIWVSSGIEKVPPRRLRARNPSNMKAEPNRVKRKNLIEA